MARRTPLTAQLPWLLVRLKARLTINRIKTARSGTTNAVITGLFGFIVGLAAAFAVAMSALTDDVRVQRGILVLGATFLLVGWTVFPLVSFGTDETLDPARLQLFPLPRRPLMAGLLGASFVGFAPLGAVLAVLGAVVGYGAGPWFLITLVDGVVLLVLCAATARALTTVLASRLSSRRGRDALVIVGSLLAIAVQGLRFVRFASIDPDVVARVVDVVRWLPPGMLGHAMFDAFDGSYGTAVIETLAPAALIPVLLSVWATALDRALTVVDGGLTVTRRNEHRGRRQMALLFDRLPFVTPTPMGAVAARELRYVSRDPKRKVLLVNSFLIGLGLPIYLVIAGGSGLQPGTVLLSTVAGYIALLSSMNQFGFDGAAAWIDMVAGNRSRDVIVGKNLALTIQVVPVMAIAGILLAAISDGWAYLPAALVIGLAGLGAGLAVANVVSVRYPQRVAENRNPFAGGGAGQGCGTASIVMLCVLTQQLVLIPVGIAGLVIALAGPVYGVVLAPAVALYGFVIWRTGLNMATRWAFWHQPELLLAIDPRRSG